MESRPVKYGVLGMGRGVDVAIEGIGSGQGKLVAACDCNPKIMEAGRKRIEERGCTDCRYFSDVDEFLRYDMDAVIIATEAVKHVPFVRKAFEAGKHVLCEIPSVASLEEAYELKNAVAAYPHLKYMAGENCCYWAFIDTWKGMYERGEFGEIVYAEAEYLHALDPKKFSPDHYPRGHWRTTQPAIHYLTHELGPLLYILGDRCVSVSCMEPDVRYDPNTPEKKECGVALLKTEKGAVIRIFISFGAYTSYDHNYRLCGTRGTVETDRLTVVDDAVSYANLSCVPNGFKEKIKIPVTTRYPGEEDGSHGGGDKKMLADFLRCIAEDASPKLDADFAIRMSLPGIIAHQSAERGGALLEIPQI